jgi:hypothetical protein
MIDPFFTVDRSLAQEKRPADAASDAVIPARNRYIDQMGTSHRHGCNSSIDPQNVTTAMSGVKITLPVLFMKGTGG